MLDLRLRYEGNGRFQVATRMDFDLVNQEFEPGALVRAKASQPRSLRQNAYFHALIEKAYENQRGGPKLPTWRHLKAYLLVEIDHCTESRVKIPKGASVESTIPLVSGIVRALRQEYDTAWVTLDPKRQEIVLRFAKPTKNLTQEEMSDVMDKVVSRICLEIVPGMDPTTILNMAKADAA